MKLANCALFLSNSNLLTLHPRLKTFSAWLEVMSRATKITVEFKAKKTYKSFPYILINFLSKTQISLQKNQGIYCNQLIKDGLEKIYEKMGFVHELWLNMPTYFKFAKYSKNLKVKVINALLSFQGKPFFLAVTLNPQPNKRKINMYSMYYLVESFRSL